MSEENVPSRPIVSSLFSPRSRGRGHGVMLREALRELVRSDPTIRIDNGPDHDQKLICGTSETHLESICVALCRLSRKPIEMGEPAAIMLETIRETVEAEGKYIRQTGGVGNYGHVKIRLKPNGRGHGFEFANAIRLGAILDEYIEPIEEGIREAMLGGVLFGYEVVDVTVTLIDGSYHDADSNAMAFRIAASQAFQEAARKASPILLEPVMEVETMVPEAHLSAVIADINMRRGRIESIDPHTGFLEIKARAPLSEMLSSSKHGRPEYPMQFAGYEEVRRPPDGFGDYDAGVTANKPIRPIPGIGYAAAQPDDEFDSF